MGSKKESWVGVTMGIAWQFLNGIHRVERRLQGAVERTRTKVLRGRGEQRASEGV